MPHTVYSNLCMNVFVTVAEGALGVASFSLHLVFRCGKCHVASDIRFVCSIINFIHKCSDGVIEEFQEM